MPSLVARASHQCGGIKVVGNWFGPEGGWALGGLKAIISKKKKNLETESKILCGISIIKYHASSAEDRNTNNETTKKKTLVS